MTPSSETLKNERWLHEVRAMRAELTTVHHELASVLKLMGTLADKVRTLDKDEVALSREIEQLALGLQQRMAKAGAPTHCPTCGGPLDRHPAMAGDLMICAGCGWSQFIDRQDGPLATTQPTNAPSGDHPADGPWVV